jgi:hypothetical protein
VRFVIAKSLPMDAVKAYLDSKADGATSREIAKALNLDLMVVMRVMKKLFTRPYREAPYTTEYVSIKHPYLIQELKYRKKRHADAQA